jgi:hypothetical protein
VNGLVAAFEVSTGDRGTFLTDFKIARSYSLSSTPNPIPRSFNGVVIFHFIQANR